MNGPESYDDPALAARTRAWMQSAAPVAAPERIVFSIMDEVDRLPRQRRLGRPALPLLGGVARYAALTLVITIGVTAGILVSRNLESVGGSPPPPTPTPSLRFLGPASGDGALLTSDQGSAWLVTREGQLVPIDSDGAAGESISLTFTPSDLISSNGSSGAYGGPGTVWLVAPDTNLLRFDSAVGEFVAARDVTGARVVLGADAAWVSRPGEVLKVNAGFMTLVSTLALPGHRAEDPMLVVGNSLWVADASGIERLDVSSGSRGTRIANMANELVAANGLVWAAAGPNLVGIDPGSGLVAITAALPTATDIVGMATHGNVIWLATAPGSRGPSLVGVDPATGEAISVTPLSTPAISIAVVGNQVWTLDAAGNVGRYEPGS